KRADLSLRFWINRFFERIFAALRHTPSSPQSAGAGKRSAQARRDLRHFRAIPASSYTRSMIGVFVSFRFTETFNPASIRAVAHNARARFEAMPGLRSKAFTLD